MKNTHGGKQGIDTNFHQNFLWLCSFADPDSVILINFKDCSFQGNAEEQETGESNAPA